MSILNYFFIGAVFTFLLDLVLTKLKNHPLMKEIIRKWGWNERIACVLVWPLGLVVFLGSLIISCFKK